MTTRRAPLMAVALMVVGMALMVWFTRQDSTVAPDGALIEAFWAWALGTGLFVAGALTYLADWLVQAIKRRHTQN